MRMIKTMIRMLTFQDNKINHCWRGVWRTENDDEKDNCDDYDNDENDTDEDALAHCSPSRTTRVTIAGGEFDGRHS